MTSLLHIAVHIFILNWWLIQQVTGLTQSKLDMAYDAFDDQYEGCIQEMEKKAPQLLQEELNMSGNKQLKSEWATAEKHWKMIKNKINSPENFNDFHGTALVTYTGGIFEDFNTAVREFRQNPDKFHYKAFHYHLTRALQLLKGQNCYNVYRGTSTKFYYSGNGRVRFGQFTSSSLRKEVALDFLKKGGTLFKINTCLGVFIKAFSLYSQEEEVLIPGYEVYKPTIKQTNEYTEIILEDPQRLKSNYNCFFSKTSSNFNSSGMIKGPEFLLLLLPSLLILLLLRAEL